MGEPLLLDGHSFIDGRALIYDKGEQTKSERITVHLALKRSVITICPLESATLVLQVSKSSPAWVPSNKGDKCDFLRASPISVVSELPHRGRDGYSVDLCGPAGQDLQIERAVRPVPDELATVNPAACSPSTFGGSADRRRLVENLPLEPVQRLEESLLVSAVQ
jgi:hypothetical protein